MVLSNSLNRLLKKREPKKEAQLVPSDSVASWEEKRKERRIEVEVLMTATTHEGHVYRAYSRDLSHGGTAAIVWGDLKVGEKVSLSYRFPQLMEEIVVPAVVCHSIEQRYGMQFVGRDKRRLQTEIARIFKTAATLMNAAVIH